MTVTKFIEKPQTSIRFKEFTDEWKLVKLNKVAEKITRKNKDFAIKNVISNSAKYGLVIQRDYFDKAIANSANIDGYYVIEEGDFVYNPRISSESPYGPINIYKYHEPGVVSPLYLCFKVKGVDNAFLSYYFKTSRWHKHIYMHGDQGARHDRVSIKDSEFFKLQFFVPSISEQQKIASFLSLLDKKIEKQEDKIKQLELLKTAMIKKVFSKEIRFKDQNGEPFPEWNSKPLGKIGDTYTGLSGKTKENFGHGESHYVTYMNVFSNVVASLDMIDRVEVHRNETQNEVKTGDILFTTSSETPDEVGMASVWLGNQEKLYLNSFCFGYRLKEEINPVFLTYQLRSPVQRRKITLLAQGSTRYNLSKIELMKIEVYIPSKLEQEKIVAYLTLMDSKLEKEKEKIQILKDQKRSFMQQLFI